MRTIEHHDGASRETIRVLLIDNHVILRESLAAVIEQEPDLTVVAQVDSFVEAGQWIAASDVMVIGLDMPDGEVMEFIRQSSAATPPGAVLVLLPNEHSSREAFAVEAGARGVVMATTPVSALIDAVRRIHAGEQLMPLEKVVDLLRFAGQERERVRAAETTIGLLTRREREVLQVLADGLNDFEAARELHVTPDTIRTHVSNILRKLGVKTRLQALTFVARYRLVEFDRRTN